VSCIVSNVVGSGIIIVMTGPRCGIATVDHVAKFVDCPLVTEWHVRSEGELEWTSIPSGSLSRFHHRPMHCSGV
jgi:hypothetical protein